MKVIYRETAALMKLLEQKNDILDSDGAVFSTTKTWIFHLSIFDFYKSPVKN